MFIANNPTKTKELLFTMIESPELSSIPCPLFTQNVCPEHFVAMYERISKTFNSSGTVEAFSALSKVRHTTPR